MKRLLLLIVAVAALVAVAAFYVPANAASVNGTQVSQATLNADLTAIAGSPGFQCYLGADQLLTGGDTTGFLPVHGVGVANTTTSPASFNSGFARYWLSELLSNQLVEQLVAARHLAVTPVDLALGRVTLTEQLNEVLQDYESETGTGCGTTAAAILASLPASFRNEQVQVQAAQDVLLAHESGYGLNTADLTRYFTLHQVRFDTICLSYVAFSSESDATAARAKVAAGASFSSVGQVSEAGCAMRYAITSLPSSVTSLAVGKVSQPVAGSNGEYALFEVTSVKHSTFVVAKLGVENSVLEAGSTRASALIRAANRRAEVTADPRYGRVAPATVDLLPPESPSTTFVLNPAVNLPYSAAGQVSSGSSTSR